MKAAFPLLLWLVFGAASDAGSSSTLDRVLLRIPQAFAPGDFALELVPGTGRIHAEVEKRTLSVSVDQLEAHSTIWLHELGHFATAGPRPTDPAARRVLTAIEEGVADYYAAALSGSPRIGDSRAAIRDLKHPPELAPETWAALGLPGFDAHPFGWSLAAKLWRAEPKAGALLADLIHTLRTGAFPSAGSPRALVEVFVRSCPLRSRHSLDQILREWIPSELTREETP